VSCASSDSAASQKARERAYDGSLHLLGWVRSSSVDLHGGDVNVEQVLLSDLRGDPKNPRKHDDRNMRAIADSLRLHGQVEPLVVQQSSMMLIAGNGRAAAMKSLGWTHATVALLDVSDREARELSIRLNRTGELASWNDDVLAQHLKDLDALAYGEDFGFNEEDLESLVAELDQVFEDSEDESVVEEKNPNDENQEYQVDEQSVESTTKSGDVIRVGDHQLHCGDCIRVMEKLEKNSVDAIVGDPPYGIGFMSKGWDQSVPGLDFARECFRVLKPGGHLILFAATRTIHRLTVAVEDAGFEIRDQISWIYWTGFPKSVRVDHELSKKHPGESQSWKGFGTGLKPATEPAVLARKPLDGTIAQSVARWGVGGLNIEGCRYPYGHKSWPGPGEKLKPAVYSQPLAPKTALGTGRAVEDERREIFVDAPSGRFPSNIYHCPKPSRAEREEGCDHLPTRSGAEAVDRKAGTKGLSNPRAGAGRTASTVRNWHPTVKPVALMRWLVRLVGGQPGSVVLDPFAGSGTTLVAAHVEGFRSVGVELDARHCDIARARLEHAVEYEDLEVTTNQE